MFPRNLYLGLTRIATSLQKKAELDGTASLLALQNST